MNVENASRNGLCFVLPLRVEVSKKKAWALNLNNYRNAHYQTLNKAKKVFSEMFRSHYGFSETAIIEKCELVYIIFPGSNRVVDLANIGSVVDKFASDCLVSFLYIRDDNRKVVKSVTYLDGGIDKDNPRVELWLITIKDGKI